MKKQIITTLIVTMALTLFAGCSNKPNATAMATPPATQSSGSLLLQVNPEILITYNEKGLVSKIEGVNDDGVKIADAYVDYIGKEARYVMSELVTLINDKGFFVPTTNEEKTIFIALSDDSKLPSENFLSDIASHVQSNVESLNFQTAPPVIVKDSNKNTIIDHIPNENTQEISRTQALDLALTHVGALKENMRDLDIDLEQDNTAGLKYYEIDFEINKVEFKFHIDATNGTILKFNNGVGDLDDLNNDLDDDLNDGINDNLDDVNDDANDDLDDVNDHSNDDLDDANDDFDDVNDHLDDVNDDFDDVNDDFNDVNDDLNDVNDDSNDVNDDLNDVNDDLNDVNDDLNDVNDDLNDHLDDVNDDNDVPDDFHDINVTNQNVDSDDDNDDLDDVNNDDDNVNDNNDSDDNDDNDD